MNDIMLDVLTKAHNETASRLDTVAKKKTGKVAEYFESLKEHYDQIFNQLIDAINDAADDVNRLIGVFDRENAELKALLDRIEKYDVPVNKLIYKQKTRDNNIKRIIYFLQQELKLPLNVPEAINILSEAISAAMHAYERDQHDLSVTKRKDLLAKLNTSLKKTYQHIEEAIQDDDILSALSYDISLSSNIIIFKEDCRALHEMVAELQTISAQKDWKAYHSPKMWDGLDEEDIIEVSEEELSESINASLKVKHKKKKTLKDNDNLDPSGFLRMLSCLKEGWDAVFTQEVIKGLPEVPRKVIFNDANEKDIEIELYASHTYFAYFVYVVEFCLHGKPNIHDYNNKVQRSLKKLEENNLFYPI